MKCVLAALALLICITGCSNQHNSRVLTIALAQEPKTLNPLLAANSYEGFIWRLMFEPLISADAHNLPIPMLAAQIPTLQNGGVSRDGLTITYHLRPHVRWTDGLPLTSEDVRFTWRAIVNSENNTPTRHGYDDIASIDTPNALTAVVHLRRPLASFVNTFFAESDQPYGILPAHVLARYRNLNQLPFNDAPTVSDGPFRIVRWAHGDRLTFTANPSFMFGKPKLDGINVLFVSNENTAVNLLRTGSVQYVVEPSITTYSELRDIPSVRTVFVPVNGYEGLGFNLRRTPMNDPRFRTAIAYGIDKKRLLHTLTFGRQKLATEDLPDWMWANDPSLKPLPFDPHKARALLAQARIAAPVELVLVTDTGNVTHQREAVMLQSMLHDIGIDLSVKTYPAGLLYEPLGAGGIIQSGKFDLALLPWIGGIDPDNSSQFACANAPPNGWNMTRYCDREMDAQQRIALTQYDQATRTAAYHRIEQLLARDNPIVFFWWLRVQQAYRTTFHGFSPNLTSESWNAWQWSLSP
jgi:peptide/nickel transport system substrate-binding protein